MAAKINPLAGKTGFTAAVSAQGQYNDLAKNWGPKVSGLVSWKSPSGTIGVSLSAAVAWRICDICRYEV